MQLAHSQPPMQCHTLYNELLKNGQSVDVYYNLGNAYYRSDNIPQALLAYERASLLDPSDKAVRFNLEFVNGKTIDKVGNANEMFFVVAYRSIVNMMSLKGWTTLSITAFMLSLLLALAYLFGTAMWMRKSGFYGALLAFAVFASSVLFAWQQHSRLVNRDGAIVVAPVVNVKKTPADSSSDAFVIHEGTRVTITDSTMRDWYGVKLNDGREGWIKKKQIELI
jgi:tetratricopeptide (TPR) repeat protein